MPFHGREKRQTPELDAVKSSKSPSSTPSLLADSQSSDTLDNRSPYHASRLAKRPKKQLIIFGGVAVLTLMTGLTWILDSPTESTGQPDAFHQASSVALPIEPETLPPLLTSESTQKAPLDSAQIINETIAEHPTNTPAPFAIAPPTVETARNQPAAPSTKVTPSRPIARVVTEPRSSDIDVLIALMHYVESPGNDLPLLTRQALQERIRACPAANTEKGIQCRQQICTDLPETLGLCQPQ